MRVAETSAERYQLWVKENIRQEPSTREHSPAPHAEIASRLRQGGWVAQYGDVFEQIINPPGVIDVPFRSETKAQVPLEIRVPCVTLRSGPAEISSPSVIFPGVVGVHRELALREACG